MRMMSPSLSIRVLFLVCVILVEQECGSASILRSKRQYDDEVFIEQKACKYDEATCRNGQCIPLSGRCNGITDCSDGSDESSCQTNQVPGRCEPNEKSCRNGHCLQKIWYCDGEKDCVDGSDEESCSTTPSGSCKSFEFECKNRNQCILKSFLCDKEFDCQDQSDEFGCASPRIVQLPVRNLTITLGSTFRIECRAVGFPDPYINWRLNWGHTCEEPRCFSTNVNGFGVFTVTDARFIDAGAYSCEAINAMGRVFAVPDTIVTIIQGRPFITRPPIEIKPEPEPTDCKCNGHSEDCTCSGRCLNCRDHTTGENCHLCAEGFQGIDHNHCEPINEPIRIQPTKTTKTTSTRPNPPSSTEQIVDEEETECFRKCHEHSYACTCSGICLNCMHNTEGDKCQNCKNGYQMINERDGTFECVLDVSNYNQPIKSKVKSCNEYGTAHQSGNTCKCKTGVTGKYCDECKPRYFNLIENNKKGCSSCFCNGLSVDCKSSDLYYRKKLSDYENEDWYLSNKFTQMKENVEFIENGIEFNKINNHANEDLYFIVSSKFKGNHLLSYNGELSFEFKFDLPESSLINNIQQLEIRISGSNINVIHVFSQDLLPNVENQISVKLNENLFKRYGDNSNIEREFLLMALSNIDLIMIKAKLANGQTSAKIRNFSLEYADSNDSSQELASSVEVCSCPTGYTGTSCESCATGYTNTNGGFYWGFCEPI